MSEAVLTATVRSLEQGERRWFFGGGLHVWKATAEETDGAFMLFEIHLDEGKVTPLHTHPDSDETLYVLEGEILVHIDGVDHRIESGGVVVAPRGVPHAFMVTSPDTRLLCLHTPGCCQDFYWDASEPVAADASESGVVDFDRVRDAATRNSGIELVGPPPFTSAEGRPR